MELDRSATKRCASDPRPELEAKRNRSRRQRAPPEEPLLVVLHRARLHSVNTPTESETDLIGSFGQTTGGETVVEVEWPVKRHDSLRPPPLGMVETDMLGSLDSRSAELGTPLDWLLHSSSCCLWSQTCSDLSRSSRSAASRSSRRHSVGGGPRPPVLSSRRSGSLGSLSSSYTSWTQPVMGRQQSDSCEPASSILDRSPECGGPGGLRLGLARPRDRSADTSKDISEIDDFELDELDDFELPHDDDEDGVKWPPGWLAASPDLAYCSMEPSHHSHQALPGS
jgi:hypothetical protein